MELSRDHRTGGRIICQGSRWSRRWRSMPPLSAARSCWMGMD